MSFPTNSELREASTGLLLARMLTPYAPLLAQAAEAEDQLNRYRGRAFGLGVSEAMADEVLEKVAAKAEELRRGFAEISITDVADEAWRCLVLHSGGLPYLPFMAYAEGLLRRETP
ncbi:hypothetical protein ABZ392_33805 [Streptomyces sp. NPDC005885]|uniref:hypothetical protein n=1 Tax=Streptomyces sp. NPDC005885 TaxID=3157079 RepID=UPI003409FD5B